MPQHEPEYQGPPSREGSGSRTGGFEGPGFPGYRPGYDGGLGSLRPGGFLGRPGFNTLKRAESMMVIPVIQAPTAANIPKPPPLPSMSVYKSNGPQKV